VPNVWRHSKRESPGVVVWVLVAEVVCDDVAEVVCDVVAVEVAVEVAVDVTVVVGLVTSQLPKSPERCELRSRFSSPTVRVQSAAWTKKC
jgi:hypothetical protein